MESPKKIVKEELSTFDEAWKRAFDPIQGAIFSLTNFVIDVLWMFVPQLLLKLLPFLFLIELSFYLISVGVLGYLVLGFIVFTITVLHTFLAISNRISPIIDETATNMPEAPSDAGKLRMYINNILSKIIGFFRSFTIETIKVRWLSILYVSSVYLFFIHIEARGDEVTNFKLEYTELVYSKIKFYIHGTYIYFENIMLIIYKFFIYIFTEKKNNISIIYYILLAFFSFITMYFLQLIYIKQVLVNNISNERPFSIYVISHSFKVLVLIALQVLALGSFLGSVYFIWLSIIAA